MHFQSKENWVSKNPQGLIFFISVIYILKDADIQLDNDIIDDMIYISKAVVSMSTK